MAGRSRSLLAHGFQMVVRVNSGCRRRRNNDLYFWWAAGMAEFYFNLIDHDGLSGSEESYAFPDLEAALAEAEIILSEMALDGLPKQPFERLEVEVLDHNRICVAKISLELRRQIFS